MKGKKMFKCLALIVVIWISLVAIGKPAAETKPIELTLTHMMGAVSYPHLAFQYYADKIYERTKGKVKITVYPVGVITPPAKIYEAIEGGIADLGHHCPAYTPGPFPASEACFLPLPAANAWAFSKMGNDFYEHFKLKELENMLFLFNGGPGPYVIATKNMPVQRPEDLKGLRMRAIGPFVDLMKMWGGIPVAMPMGDVYEALSKGVIDGGIIGFEAIGSFKFGDHLKYVTIAPVGVTYVGFVVMNLNKWNALPKDVQEVFKRTNEDMKDWYANAWQYGDLEGVKYFLGLPGREVLEIPPTEKEKFVKLAAPLTEKYIKEKSAMGLPAADYVKYLWERAEYWNKEYPGDKKIREWVEKELKKPE